jgi:hypothetical protein
MERLEKQRPKSRLSTGKRKPAKFRDVVQKLLETGPQRGVKVSAPSRKINK